MKDNNVKHRALRARMVRLSVGIAAMSSAALPTAGWADSIGPAVPTVGQHFVAPPVDLPAAAIVGAPGAFVGLSLQDAVAMALSRNTDLEISESDRRIAHWDVIAARGPFDLRFNISPSYQYEKQAPLSPFSVGPNGVPVTQQTDTLSTGVSAETLSGQQISLSASASRIEGNSTANGYDPYYPTALSLAITQPFGRGRLGDDRKSLELAVATSHAQAAAALVTASNSIATVTAAYWNLLAAWRQLGIQEQSLVQARAQTESNNRLVARGQAAPLDIAESNTQVDVDTDNVLSATATVARLENQLKSLILDNPGDPLWNINLVPTSPVADVPAEPNLAQITANAIALRPELAQIRASRRTADVNLAFARDEARPQLDLKLQVTSNGFAGEPGNLAANPLFSDLTPQTTAINKLIAANPGAGATMVPTFNSPFLPGTLGRLGTSFQSLFENRYPVYGAQLNFSVPFHDDRAIGAINGAREREHEVDTQTNATLQRILMEIRNAVQNFDAAKSRLVAAHAARDAADRVLSGEQRRFKVGESTTFLVLQRQVEDATDQGRELQAQTDLNISISELDRVTGAIFARNGFHVRNGEPDLDSTAPMSAFESGSRTSGNASGTNAGTATGTNPGGGSSSGASPGPINSAQPLPTASSAPSGAPSSAPSAQPSSAPSSAPLSAPSAAPSSAASSSSASSAPSSSPATGGSSAPSASGSTGSAGSASAGSTGPNSSNAGSAAAGSSSSGSASSGSSGGAAGGGGH